MIQFFDSFRVITLQIIYVLKLFGTVNCKKKNYIQSVLNSKNLENEEMPKWGILSLSEVTKSAHLEKMEGKERVEHSSLSSIICHK